MTSHAPFSVTPLGWQYAVRRLGILVSVHDTREEASLKAQELSKSSA